MSTQQALMGQWLNIVGRAAHGGHGASGAHAAAHGGHHFHGGHHVHHHGRGDRDFGRWGWGGWGWPWWGYGGWGYPYAYDYPYDGVVVEPARYVFGGPRRVYHLLGAEPEAGGAAIPPRNALVEAPGPDHAGREVLPMSTGVAILPTQSAQITARPQRVAFRPERVFISAAGTSGGAADWVVNDIKIGNRSQFSQSGDVPGDMFATNAIDGFVSFETAQTAMDVVMVVTYIGLNESGVPFFASIVGTAAI
jgi:hypothetical protein